MGRYEIHYTTNPRSSMMHPLISYLFPPLLRKFPPTLSSSYNPFTESAQTQAKKLLMASQCPIHPSFPPIRFPKKISKSKHTTALRPRSEELLSAPNRSGGWGRWANDEKRPGYICVNASRKNTGESWGSCRLVARS
jgi:hypothetical protein